MQYMFFVVHFFYRLVGVVLFLYANCLIFRTDQGQILG